MSIKKVKEKQTELFKEMEVDQKSTNSDTFDADLYELSAQQPSEPGGDGQENLEQLMFEDSREHFRVI